MTSTPSPFITIRGGCARISAGWAIGCQIGLALFSTRKFLSRMIALSLELQPEMPQRLAVGRGRVAYVKQHRAHVARNGAGDIATLVVDEHAIVRLQRQFVQHALIGAGSGFRISRSQVASTMASKRLRIGSRVRKSAP